MSCSVAISNSPVFSPSSIFCNKTPIISPSQDTVNLTLTQRIPSSFLSSSSSSVSKRKRPAKLNIPVVTTAVRFGVPETPCDARREVESEGGDYSVYCKRGRREAMEDRFSASVKLQGDTKQAFFGVFDGHGGAKAAEFASQKLEKNIFAEVVRTRDDSMLKEAVKQGYLKTDAEFLKEDVTGGTCCVTAMIQNGNLVVSNAGDCRAVLSRAGVGEALTSDHRPSRADEKTRIESSGGYVDLCRGTWRIQGCLAVSRGIGDQHLKQWVIAEPETTIISVEPECEFLILASDGLWDNISNQEAVDIARPSCVGIKKTINPLSACKELVDLSVSRGSTDDITVMLIQLGNYASFSDSKR